jgi:hypothetical protein
MNELIKRLTAYGWIKTIENKKYILYEHKSLYRNWICNINKTDEIFRIYSENLELEID